MENREGFYFDGVTRECTNCGTHFKITSKTVTLCGKCNSERVTSESAEVRMWRRAKNRAKVRGQEFLLGKEDIDIPTTCPILGVPLEVHKGKPGGSPNSPALDRVDNTKGYIKGNIMVTSHLANMMKSSADNKTLRQFAKWVLNNIPEEA